MKTQKEILNIAKTVISIETEAVKNLANFIDDDFFQSVKSIFECKGRVIVSGIGKSAIIAQKIVGTLNSTGTPSIFMHAADAIHGDLGIIQTDDVVLLISKSGNTPEIEVLIPLIKTFGNTIIAIVSNENSFLAKNAHYVLKAPIEREACPNNLAPTSSSTAHLVIGDALAVCLLECRNFSSEDFAKYHPGGTLGKRLYLRVSDLCSKNERPVVNINELIENVLLEMSAKRLGMTAVVNNENKLCGIITDGDIRRMLQKHQSINGLKASDVMSTNPKQIAPETLAFDAYETMKTNKITQLIVVENNEYVGVVHLHDILREGIV